MAKSDVKVLVTGGRGFIGSNLVRELESRGYDVWACDLMHCEREKYVRCDVSKYRQVERVFEGNDFDFVYHAAAEYGRWNGEDYYENLWLTNAVGTKNILRLQEKKRFRMVFFGSAEVYGDYDGVMSEDVMEKVPIKPMNDYALSDWISELTGNEAGVVFKSGRACNKVVKRRASIEKAMRSLIIKLETDMKLVCQECTSGSWKTETT